MQVLDVRRLTRHAGGLLAATLILSTATAQDLIGYGFAETASQPTPVAFASYDTLPSGDRIVFDGLSIDRYDGNGAFVQNLATLPAFVFNSFVEADPSSTFAIVGESSNGDIFRVALNGSGYSTIANLNFNYDGVFEDPGHILISAATCGFGCGNDLVRVDTTTGQMTFLANVDGPSGPVALDAQGALYYATVDTNIASNTQIISWSQAQLNSGSLLDESDATVLHAGLEAAASLAIDPEFGNVFLAESVFGGTSRVLEFDVSNGNLVDVVVESANYLTNLELMQGASIGHFHEYQPEDGVFLHYNNGDIITVRPQRPSATFNQVGNVATISITGAEPDGAMLMLFADQNFYDPNYITTILGNSGYQFHAAATVNRLRRSGPLLIPIDSNGDGSFSYFDSGNLAGTLVFQALITNTNGGFIGSSTAVLN